MHLSVARRQCATACGCTFVVTGTAGRSDGHGRFASWWSATAAGEAVRRRHAEATTPASR
jgi:hypothetical protein